MSAFDEAARSALRASVEIVHGAAEMKKRIAELEVALRDLATVPAVLQVLGREHAPGCHCPLCRANLLLRAKQI